MKGKEEKRRTTSLPYARHSMTSSVAIPNYTFVICPNSRARDTDWVYFENSNVNDNRNDN